MEQIINDLKTFFINAGMNIIWALIVIIVGFKLVEWFKKVLKDGKAFNKLDKTVKSFLISFSSATLKIIVLIIAASIIGIPMTTIVALITSASVAIGLALQGGLSNLAGGIMIMIFKPFKVGDYILASGKEGTVYAITLFYTIVTTLDNKRVMLPNGTLTNEAIVNYTALPKRRLDIDFDVSYDSDITKVKKVISDVLSKEKNIISTDEMFVRLTKEGASALTFTVRVWVKQNDFLTTRYNLLENVKEAFDKNKIEIPYNQVDVHIKNK